MKSENLGAFYKYINTSYRPAIGALTDDGGNIKTDDHDKAQLFNSYFATVCMVDNGKIPVGQSLFFLWIHKTSHMTFKLTAARSIEKCHDSRHSASTTSSEKAGEYDPSF